ncbi:MAG: DUF4838 domain-containing protein [Clostridia bacterium]|nr:DUF4838 domain-containing protein [Clostridia bacterium]
MKRTVTLLVLAAVIISCIGVISAAVDGSGKTVDLVKDGKAVYSIVYSDFWIHNSDHLEIVEFLRDTIASITGVELPVYSAESGINDREIFIGNTRQTISNHKTRVSEGGMYSVDEALMGDDGFLISKAGDRYILSAAGGEGARQAVIFFIEKVLGYSFSDLPDEKVSTLSAPEDIRVFKSSLIECDTEAVMEIGGTDIGEFDVIYSADMDPDAGENKSFFSKLDSLRKYIFALTGKSVTLKDDSGEPSGHEIVVGKTNRRNFSVLDEKETVITAEDGSLFICGGNGYTTLKACDAFSSAYLGIKGGRYEGTGAIRIPADMEDKGKEQFAVFAAEGTDQTKYLRDNMGSLLGNDDTPCFSDPATADKIYEAIVSGGHRTGDEVFITCNRADWCSCEECAGGTAAFLETVNKVADRLAGLGISVSTVAANETRRPSVGRMSDNVRIYIAEPNVCCAHALGDTTCEENKKIAEDMMAWSKVSDRVCILDYTMNYQFYPSTFPNFGAIGPNFSFYCENGVDGVLMVWREAGAMLEFGDIRIRLLEALASEPSIGDEDFDRLMDRVIDGLYGESTDAVKEYISKFSDAAAEHFTIFTSPGEILPIERTGEGNGAGAYDLTLAKKLAGIWESIYERHDPPDPPLTGFDMYFFEQDYYSSDYYLPLHSRVQLTEWIDANIPHSDRNAVYTEIAASFAD